MKDHYLQRDDPMSRLPDVENGLHLRLGLLWNLSLAGIIEMLEGSRSRAFANVEDRVDENFPKILISPAEHLDI